MYCIDRRHGTQATYRQTTRYTSHVATDDLVHKPCSDRRHGTQATYRQMTRYTSHVATDDTVHKPRIDKTFKMTSLSLTNAGKQVMIKLAIHKRCRLLIGPKDFVHYGIWKIPAFGQTKRHFKQDDRWTVNMTIHNENQQPQCFYTSM